MPDSTTPYINIHVHPGKEKSGEWNLVSCFPDQAQSYLDAGASKICIGIHPWYLEESSDKLREIACLANHSHVLAIGECGLDPFSSFSLKEQLPVFREQIFLSEELGKPLVVHCVKEYHQLLNLRKELKTRQPWVIHGFRGKATLAEQLIRSGCFISISPVATAKPEYIRSLWEQAQASKLFLESDEEPGGVRPYYNVVSEALQVEERVLQELFEENLNALFPGW